MNLVLPVAGLIALVALTTPSVAAVESAEEPQVVEPRLCFIGGDDTIGLRVTWCPVPTGAICVYGHGIYECVDPTG